MYIEPNTTIKILRYIPLDTTYDHTLYWAPTGKTAQTTYFSSKAKYTLDKRSYQRVQRGWMRVNIAAENLYDCNYLMFQNTAFGIKWFYAFIKSVEYVNNNVSQIEFEIDIMQTWYFDYVLEPCLIEREHSATDNIGDNLVPEKLELGEYIHDQGSGTGHLDDLSIVIAATFDRNYAPSYGSVRGGVYSGLEYIDFPGTYSGGIDAALWIDYAVSHGKGDGIVGLFYAPTDFITPVGLPAAQYNITQSKNYTDIDGYVPHNNKLFTYPYNFLYVTNLQGESTAYPYEYFSTPACNFALTGDFTSTPTAVLIPKNYKGSTLEYDEMMALTGFPVCAFNTDQFKAWWAQTAAALPVTIPSIGLTALSGIAMGGGATSVLGVQGITNAAGQALNILGQGLVQSIKPAIAHGTQSNTTMYAIGALDYRFYHKHIRAEFAEIIDKYFDMYGYASHKVKIPNTHVRVHWTFTKTSGCKIVGSMPADDEKKICSIYDKGVTFWVDPDEVGNYNLLNPIIGVTPNAET